MAGVPHYWRVESEPVVEVVAYALVDGSYREAVRVSEGTATLPGPFPFVVDIEDLARP